MPKRRSWLAGPGVHAASGGLVVAAKGTVLTMAGLLLGLALWLVIS